MNYDSAKSNCASKFSDGGKLFEPTTLDVNQLVGKAYEDTIVSDGSAVWIGVNDIANETNFEYTSSGASIPFSPQWWTSNTDSRDCVSLWFTDWGTEPCHYTQRSICQQFDG